MSIYSLIIRPLAKLRSLLGDLGMQKDASGVARTELRRESKGSSYG